MRLARARRSLQNNTSLPIHSHRGDLPIRVRGNSIAPDRACLKRYLAVFARVAAAVETVEPSRILCSWRGADGERDGLRQG